jgi:hypothetical protein
MPAPQGSTTVTVRRLEVLDNGAPYSEHRGSRVVNFWKIVGLLESLKLQMIFLKALAVGVVSGLLLAVLWVLAALWLPLYLDMFLSYWRNEGGGVGASSVGSGSALLAAIIGFAVGFYWTVRRARHQRSPISD